MENKKLTLGSLFSGSGGFELAGVMAGVRPVFLSEIEPFAVRVTEKRLPEVKQYGDVSKLSGADLPPVDIITFGSPCQDMSVAGKRAGLEGSRSGLFHQAIRIIKEMREATHGHYPKYAVWENVKGAFSSNKGEDFRAVLEAFCQVEDPEAVVPMPEKSKWSNAGCIVGDGYSVAWRLFDSQHWNVPQRRERIYLVADFTEERAGEILFVSEGLSGYTAESSVPWKGFAGGVEEGTRETVTVLNDQGGSVMSPSEDVTGTLRAETHGHPPVVAAAGFCTEHSAAARGIGYQEETSPTLRTGTVPAAIALEHHPNDGRIKIEQGDAIQTLTGRCGTGGGNVPIIMETPKTLKIRSGCEGGGKGPLIQDNKSATLGTHNDQTLFEPKAFGLCSKTSNAMLSDNPNTGFYEAETSRCLDQGSGSPTRNQGGIVVVEGNGQRPSHQGDGYKESDVSYTLNATEQHGVAYGLDRASYNQGANAKFGFSVEEELEPAMVARGPNAVGAPIHSSKASFFMNHSDADAAETLVATDYKDPPTVCEDPYYIVRRLTPVECARLQGFPDWWLDELGSAEPTDEEVERWMAIFSEFDEAVGRKVKPKTANQVRKWLKDPYSDSAAYKLWGNGITLSVAYFVLSGIVWAHNLPEQDAQDCGTYLLNNRT